MAASDFVLMQKFNYYRMLTRSLVVVEEVPELTRLETSLLGHSTSLIPDSNLDNSVLKAMLTMRCECNRFIFTPFALTFEPCVRPLSFYFPTVFYELL